MGIDLQNKTVLVTREAGQAHLFAEKIKRFGGHPEQVPLLKVSRVTDGNHYKIFDNIQNYEWLFFTSANGIRYFFELWSSYFTRQDLADKNFAVVGRKTGEVLRSYGYQARFIPRTYNAKTMAKEFLKKYDPKFSVLLIRGEQSSPILPQALLRASVEFDSLTVYRTFINIENGDLLNEKLASGKIDYITLTSPSIVDAFYTLSNHGQKITEMNIVCIGTSTARRASEKGLRNLLIPKYFTIEGMIARMSDHIAWEEGDCK
ncbi:uroporphyrinogen-III synthase [Amphibacillus sp. MSJ-3]|uniref:uroporphyrinogen-III synthase n=1 Tax=Amphibacillus sp. MSJ-3 TaxID=2841505 RepID=UPI001C0F368B|nr:uroporphyrinogen-III synthase [Amphibacillus sp. MSJ-3]MBU5595303.1 uroporphyrinogen-III synthase [Amphibacillus sp. MSJ-3]